MQPVTDDIHYTEGFADPSPWPDLEIGAPNSRWASLLAEDYAGADGELTASLQYIYHHAAAKDCPDISRALEKISIVEMMHMEKLAGAIRALGGDPTYCAGGRPWCAAEVRYGGSLGEYLHADLAGEYAAIRNYRRHIAQIGDEGVCKLLARIVKDEEVHLRIFRQLIEKYGL